MSGGARLALTIATLAGLASGSAPAQVSLGVNNVLHVRALGPATTNCDSLRDVLAAITDSSPANRYTVRLEPGRYDCGTQTVGVPPAVALVGWGWANTTISGSVDHTLLGLVHLGDHAALRGLTVDNHVLNPQLGGIAVSVWSLAGQAGDVHIEDVRLQAANGPPRDWAVFISHGKVAVRDSLLVDTLRAENTSVVTVEYSLIKNVSFNFSTSSVGCRFVYASGFGELDDSCLLAP